MFAPTEHWIAAFTAAVYGTMVDVGCPANSCVEAACIGVGVARAYGYLAEPVPVAVRAVGTADTAVMVPGPNREGRRRPGFDGHLVLHFAGGAFVDLTAAQFDWPAHSIRVPGPIVIYDVDRDQLADWSAVTLETGTSLSYRELVGDVAWRALPAWTESSDLTIRIAVRNLRVALGAAQPAGT